MLKRNLNFIDKVLPSVNVFFRRFWASLGDICHMVCCLVSFYLFSIISFTLSSRLLCCNLQQITTVSLLRYLRC